MTMQWEGYRLRIRYDETFHGGYLPGAALGLSSLDAEGFTRDAWGTPANRIRYAVHGGVTRSPPLVDSRTIRWPKIRT